MSTGVKKTAATTTTTIIIVIIIIMKIPGVATADPQLFLVHYFSVTNCVPL